METVDYELQLWLGRGAMCFHMAMIALGVGMAAFAATRVRKLGAPPTGPFAMAGAFALTLLAGIVLFVADLAELSREPYLAVSAACTFLDLLSAVVLVVGLLLIRPAPAGGTP